MEYVHHGKHISLRYKDNRLSTIDLVGRSARAGWFLAHTLHIYLHTRIPVKVLTEMIAVCCENHMRHKCTLEVNEVENVYMLLSRHQNAEENHYQ
jgi:hypothetical protein